MWPSTLTPLDGVIYLLLSRYFSYLYLLFLHLYLVFFSFLFSNCGEEKVSGILSLTLTSLGPKQMRTFIFAFVAIVNKSVFHCFSVVCFSTLSCVESFPYCATSPPLIVVFIFTIILRDQRSKVVIFHLSPHSFSCIILSYIIMHQAFIIIFHRLSTYII